MSIENLDFKMNTDLSIDEKLPSGFKSQYFDTLYNLESLHWWFRARNKLIIWAFKKFSPDFKTFMEIGCGTGYVLSAIAKAFPKAEIHGSELFEEGLHFAALRIENANLIQLNATNMKFVEEFDVVGAFDVIEHINEDELVLAGMFDALKPGGYMMLTVPQHPFLWSSADKYWCHVRRYTSTEIHAKVIRAGFDVVKSTSFVSLLLPIMLIQRLKNKNRQDFNGFEELLIHPFLNNVLEYLMAFERSLIRLGLVFSLGGSRLIVAKKPSVK